MRLDVANAVQICGFRKTFGHPGFRRSNRRRPVLQSSGCKRSDAHIFQTDLPVSCDYFFLIGVGDALVVSIPRPAVEVFLATSIPRTIRCPLNSIFRTLNRNPSSMTNSIRTSALSYPTRRRNMFDLHVKISEVLIVCLECVVVVVRRRWIEFAVGKPRRFHLGPDLQFQ